MSNVFYFIVIMRFSFLHLFSIQLFDQAAVAEIVLHNTGQVGLNFVVLNVDSGNKPLPGAPNVSPIQGYIKALSQQTLTIRYLPGVPEKFEKTFQVRPHLTLPFFH